MARRSLGTSRNQPAAPKKISVEIISETNDAGEVRQPHRIMRELIATHHQHLAEAKIALAWRFGWHEDKDGHIVLGKCQKCNDANASLHGFDFIIMLNHAAWNAAEFVEEQMRALIDHELCHAAVTIDDTGDPKVDEAGRTVWRIRKHDVEEFNEVVHRHGTWKDDLVRFAEEAIERKAHPLTGAV